VNRREEEVQKRGVSQKKAERGGQNPTTTAEKIKTSGTGKRVGNLPAEKAQAGMV